MFIYNMGDHACICIYMQCSVSIFIRLRQLFRLAEEAPRGLITAGLGFQGFKV